LEKILNFTKGTKLITAMDSDSRAKTWHDVLTNSRGKLLEKFFASNQLHIVNEDSARTRFQSSRGSSNIDLTIVNNQMLSAIKEWEISEGESYSDHNIIKFNLNFVYEKAQTYNFLGRRYIIKEQQHTEFYKNLLQLISKNFHVENNGGGVIEIDEKLNTKLTGQRDIGVFIEKFDETVQLASKKTCKHLKSPNTTAKGKSVP
jgi:hypothetical protein